MRRTDPVALEHALERFEYSRVGSQWAVVRLLARLSGELGAPSDAQLVVSNPDEALEPLLVPARACSLERRLVGRSGRKQAGTELLWRAAFALPIEIIQCRDSVFELTTEGFALALPAPGLRIVTPRTLALASTRSRRSAQPAWYDLGAARRRAVAIATAVAVTAGSTPAAALADASAGGSTGAGGTTTGSAGGAQDPNGTGATTGGGTTGSTGTGTTTGTTPTGTTTGTGTGTTTTIGTTGTGGTGTGTTGTGSTGTGTGGTGTGTGGTGTGTGGTGTGTTGSGGTTSTGTGTTGTGTSGGGASTTAPTTETGTTGTSAPGTGASGSSGGSKIQSDAAHRANAHPGSRHSRAGHHHRRGGKSVTCTPAAAANPVAVIAGAGQPLVKGPQALKKATCVTSAGHHSGQWSSSSPTKSNASAPEYGNTLGSWAKATRPAPESRANRRLWGKAGVALSIISSKPPVSLPTGGVPVLSSTPPGVAAPTAWTGTVLADPALTGAVNNLSGLLSNGNRPPSFLIPIYMEAGKRYGVPWEVLAAINAIETDYGRDLSTSSAGAVGWMQFEPSTWKEYGRAVDGHSVPNPYDPRDAIFAAARYLAAAGARQNIARAVYAYNHANWYVQEVLDRAAAIATHAQFERQTLKKGVFSIYLATGVRKHPTIRYRSGKLSHYDRLIAAANMVSAANFPYLYGGGHEQPARWGPFDCSGSVSYVMQQAGYKVPTTVSGDIPIWKFPSGPGRVTIFYNPTHTFMRIGNKFFGTSGFARPGGGAGWFDVNRLPADYLSQFREVHVPRLGVNSFAPPKHRKARRQPRQ